MRRWWIAAVVLLLLSACHRRQEAVQRDSVEEAVPVVATDSVPERGKDSVVAPKRTGEYELQQDSAEITNLRLFARKQRVIYSPDKMIGEWLQGSEHEQYMADGTGRRWDTDDDVSRVEAQVFSWTMDSNLLTIRYDLKLGGIMIRQYLVTFVDEESLAYRDAFDGTFMFDKVPSGFTDHP